MDSIKYFIKNKRQVLVRQTTIAFISEEIIEQKEKLKDIATEYKTWLKNLRNLAHKRYYRKVIREITSKYLNYKKLGNPIWECQIWKANCIWCWIKRKIIKHEKEITTPNSDKNRSMIFWINHWFVILEEQWIEVRPDWNPNWNVKSKEYLKRVETWVKWYLSMIYHWLLFSMALKEVPQMYAYFAIVERIKPFIEYTRDPRTLGLFETVHLLRIKFSIENSDFVTAWKYLKLTMDWCFRELFLIVDFDEGLNETTTKDKRKNIILTKVFINLVLSFYMRGVCYEYLGKITKAVESYKQCSFFGDKFLGKTKSEFVSLFILIENRGFWYHDILTSLKEQIKAIQQQRRNEENLKRKQIENKNRSKRAEDEVWKNITTGQRPNNSKELENVINNLNECNQQELNLPKTEKQNEHKNSTMFLSTVKWVDNWLNDEFIPLLKTMKKIEPTNFDVDTLYKVNHQLSWISHSNEHKPAKKKILTKCNKGGNQGDNNLCILNSSKNNVNLNNSIMNKTSSQTAYSYISPMKRSKSNTSAITNFSAWNKIERYKLDKSVFEKTLKTKRKFLQKYLQKEINFHKKVLKWRGNEEVRVVDDDDKKISRDAECAFKFGWMSWNSRNNKKKLNNYKFYFMDSKSKITLPKGIKKSRKNVNFSLDLGRKSNHIPQLQEKTLSCRTDRALRLYEYSAKNVFKLNENLSNSKYVDNINHEMIRKIDFDCTEMKNKMNTINKIKTRSRSLPRDEVGFVPKRKLLFKADFMIEKSKK